jgi:t-SNARE complex subunit (syntaxin)
MFRFKPSVKSVERYHNVVTCALNIEDIFIYIIIIIIIIIIVVVVVVVVVVVTASVV